MDSNGRAIGGLRRLRWMNAVGSDDRADRAPGQRAVVRAVAAPRTSSTTPSLHPRHHCGQAMAKRGGAIARGARVVVRKPPPLTSPLFACLLMAMNLFQAEGQGGNPPFCSAPLRKKI